MAYVYTECTLQRLIRESYSTVQSLVSAITSGGQFNDYSKHEVRLYFAHMKNVACTASDLYSSAYARLPTRLRMQLGRF
jgi:muramidase (phage lysozyme)